MRTITLMKGIAMFAIKLSPENIDKIIALDPKAPTKEELTETYEQNQVVETLAYYYVPDFVTKYGYAYNGWAMLRYDLLVEDYDCTPSNTDVFEIKLK
jgi:hypothetical protein